MRYISRAGLNLPYFFVCNSKKAPERFGSFFYVDIVRLCYYNTTQKRPNMQEEERRPTEEGTEDAVIIKEGKVYAILAYIGILCLIALLIKKDNKFAFFHAKQGLVIFIAEIAFGIIGMIPFLGWLIAFLGLILLPIICFIAIIQVLMGNYWRIPVIADIADKINI